MLFVECFGIGDGVVPCIVKVLILRQLCHVSIIVRDQGVVKLSEGIVIVVRCKQCLERQSFDGNNLQVDITHCAPCLFLLGAVCHIEQR